jgi:fructokinase
MTFMVVSRKTWVGNLGETAILAADAGKAKRSPVYWATPKAHHAPPSAAAPSASALQVLGEALMDCFEEPDGRLHPRMGGSPFNLARAAARQGRAVRWLTPFSTDAFGQTLRRQALADGIHPDVPASAWPTALAVVSFEGESARYGFYREGIADRDWSAVSLLSALTDQPPGVLHTGSLMLVPRSTKPRWR